MTSPPRVSIRKKISVGIVPTRRPRSAESDGRVFTPNTPVIAICSHAHVSAASRWLQTASVERTCYLPDSKEAAIPPAIPSTIANQYGIMAVARGSG